MRASARPAIHDEPSTNFGKRAIKSPKVFFVDSGLACHLLGVDTAATLRHSTFHGPLFEGFVAAEIAKQQVNAGGRAELYYFRDQQGLEVDFVVPRGARRLALLEVKASRTAVPAMARSMTRLDASIKKYDTQLMVVHAGEQAGVAGRALAPRVSAVTLPELLDELA